MIFLLKQAQQLKEIRDFDKRFARFSLRPAASLAAPLKKP
jgi:hypothetical protein